MGKLINRIQGSCLLISSLPVSALRTRVEWLDKPHDFNKPLSKPCRVNLISKDTRLVFSIYVSTNTVTAAVNNFCNILID